MSKYKDDAKRFWVLRRLKTDLETYGEGTPIGRFGADYARTLARLIAEGAVSLGRGKYYITEAGSEALKDAEDKPHYNTHEEASKWKWEALTGCDSRGKQSSIDWAALPGGGRKYCEVERSLEILSFLRKLSGDLKLSTTDCVKLLADGSVRLCNRCNKWRPHNVSRHRKTGRQAYCRDCMKQTKRRK